MPTCLSKARCDDEVDRERRRMADAEGTRRMDLNHDWNKQASVKVDVQVRHSFSTHCRAKPLYTVKPKSSLAPTTAHLSTISTHVRDPACPLEHLTRNTPLTAPRHNGRSHSSRCCPRRPPHPHPPRPPSLQIRCHWPRRQHVVLRKPIFSASSCDTSDFFSS